MSRKTLALIAVLLTVAGVALAKFVIVRQDGTLAVIDDEQLTFEQQGESFTVNGMDVSQVGHIYHKEWDRFGDYERAFTQGYLSTDYLAKPRQQQITSQEFKALLKPLIEQFQPDSMAYFNEYITDYDAPLTRGMACCMAYYVARSIGVETGNALAGSLPADFWESPEGALWDVLPHWVDEGEDNAPDEMFWRSKSFGGLQTAWMWNHLHWSEYSRERVIALDTSVFSYRWNDLLTWGEAIEAIARLNDSFMPTIVYVDIDDPRVMSPDNNLISPDLIAKASKQEIHDIDDLPRLNGFQIGPEHNPAKQERAYFDETPRIIREWAGWGFNSVKFLVSYWLLFSRDMTQANLSTLQALDELIAASMDNGVHFVLCLTDIPGRGMWLPDDTTQPYIMDNDIQNPEKRNMAKKLWNVLANRYKDVPNVSLSFCPVQEIGTLLPESAGNFGNADKTFTYEEITDFTDLLFNAIREVSPERFIFYDDFHGNLAQNDPTLFANDKKYRDHVTEKYNNTRVVINQMDMGFGFYTANQGDGNIDYASHSHWMPYYPIYQYAARATLHGERNQLILDGCLPVGMTLELYLESANDAELSIKADGNVLYEEFIEGAKEYTVGFGTCYGEPFRPSDKKISVTLDSDATEIVISSGNGSLVWCGINVVLPDSYGVERWRRDSQWDVDLGILAPEDFHGEFYKKRTSTIQIGATWWEDDDRAGRITINDDVTFKSDVTWIYSDREFQEQFCLKFLEMAPRWSCRMEDINNADNESSLRYFEDMMAVFQKYKIDVWSGVCNLLMEEAPFYAPWHIAGYEGETFEGHQNFNLPLLRILQKYQDK